MAIMFDGYGGYGGGYQPKPSSNPNPKPPKAETQPSKEYEDLAARVAEMEERLIVLEVEKACREAQEIDEQQTAREAQEAQEALMLKMRKHIRDDLRNNGGFN